MEKRMTDEQRDALLQRLEAGMAKLADMPAKVDRILEIVQGQAAARIATDDRVAKVERSVAELGRAAG